MNGLKSRETTLLSVMRTHQDRWGEVRLTMVELTELTSMSRTTLWRALARLTEQGYLKTKRTKRNFGKLYKNVYTLLKSETSTADQGNQDSNTVITTGNLTIKVKNTSYSLGRYAPKEEKMVNKWTDEDEGLAAFGLVDMPQPVEKIKKVPKTRHLRPRNEWTAHDVASEFTAQVYDRVRGIPGLVNTRNLGIALATNRKKFGITADQELQLMDRFFTDDQNLLAVKRFPKRTTGIFLSYITKNIADISNTVTVEQVVAMEDKLEYLHASDGRKFLKSMSGRQELAEYEEMLKEKKAQE